MAGPIRKPTSANDLRNRRTFIAEIGPDTYFRIRRISMMDLVLNKLIPTHLLNAASRFEKMQEEADKAASDGNLEKLAEAGAQLVNSGISDDTLKFLRAYAVAVCVEPKVVMVEDGNPEHLFVGDLTGEELTAIFYATPDGSPKEDAPVSKDQAEDFRRTEPRVPAPVLPPSEGVQPAPQLVDTPEREGVFA